MDEKNAGMLPRRLDQCTPSREICRKLWCARVLRSYLPILPEVWPIACQSDQRRRSRPGDNWHLDEVCITINKECHYLWRAMDQERNGLDMLRQPQRD